MEIAQTLKSWVPEFAGDLFSFDEGDLATYGRDWTTEIAAHPSALARPRNSSEVCQLLRRCQQHKIPIVPSGGRTGLAGGAVAAHGELVLSMERMRQMDPVDRLSMTVRVEAGAVTQAVHQHCAQQGLFWPVDFASKGSSQVGGNISTNAGGVRVIRYGLTRHWVLGLEVATASGELLVLNGALEKNNTGVDFRQLFIGTEGIFGIVTAATLKLTRLPDKVDVLLLSLKDLQSVLQLFEQTRFGPFDLSAYEFFTSACLDRLLRHRRLPEPLSVRASHYVLLEVENAQSEGLQQWLEGLLEKGLVSDGTWAQNPEQQRSLWQYREGISESLSATGMPHKNDIALPVSKLHAFCTEFENLLRQEYQEFELCLFGHIGDGNLHVNIMKPDGMEKGEFLQKVHPLDLGMMQLVARHQGSVSAEHGIGLLKKEWLSFSKSPTEIEWMRQMKRILDPSGIFNPGKIF